VKQLKKKTTDRKTRSETDSPQGDDHSRSGATVTLDAKRPASGASRPPASAGATTGADSDFSGGIFDDTAGVFEPQEAGPAPGVSLERAAHTSAVLMDTLKDAPAEAASGSLSEELDGRRKDAAADVAETTGAGDRADDQRPPRRRTRGRRGGARRSAKARAEKAAEESDEGPASPPSDRVASRISSRTADADPSPAPSRRSTAAKGPTKGEPRREMLINGADADEVRIAMLSEGRLDELYFERAASVSNVGNIYKGRITNVEPSIQAAFIDFGLPMQGFLHISDLHPRYFSSGKSDTEQVGRKTPRRSRPPIQTCLRRGQEVIVQVIKEGVGTKGPTLSSYISLPGRFLVMMPGMEQLGVSRKIEDDEQRRKMRDLLAQLTLPGNMGFIVRTAGIDRTKRDLQRDLTYLARLWERVEARIKNEPAPATLYRESDLVIRTIRDVYDSNLDRIVVDNPAVASRVREFLRIASPRAQDVVELYDGAEPLFHRYGIEHEIDQLQSRHVPLPCGGSLVIESTEALVAIDVNSGRFRVPENAEETAYRVNIEAADEIARQLRLRDLGGLIICDFIDMLQDKHRRAVERRLSDALKKHKERAKLLRISRFGLLEMTRQRQRPSFAKGMFRECPQCAGTGRVKAVESVALDLMRRIRLASHREGVASIDVRVSTAVANDLLNRKRHQISELERLRSQSIRIHGTPGMSGDDVSISCTDRRGREVGGGPVVKAAEADKGSGGVGTEGPARPSAEGPPRKKSRRGGRSRSRGGKGRSRNKGDAAPG
jgi:ribonuclease E